MAKAGDVVNFAGACAASDQPHIFAIGLRFRFLTADSDARTTAAAPSDMGDAFAAVIVPSDGLKDGRSVLVFASLN